MPDFTQSLTIRILGDSSHFERTLDAVMNRLNGFAARVERLSRVLVSLNIAPALASLGVLNRALDAAAARLQMLTLVPQAPALPMRHTSSAPFAPQSPFSFFGPTASSVPRSQFPPAASSSSVTNLGGVTINVSRPADPGSIVRDLRHQGYRLRNRRG